MSPINTNALITGFSANPLPGGQVAPDRFGQTWQTAAAPADDIRYTPWGRNPVPNDPLGTSNGGTASSPAGSNFSSMMSAFMDAISNMLSQLGSMFGGAGTQPGGSPAGTGQSFFKNASASSVGDPHESFSGTTESGNNVSSKWDSMQAHDNLLSSDSFDGGYRVSTSVTAPNGRGVTQNDRANVISDGGATNVMMKKDGSYAVTSHGQSLSLLTGRATQLDNGETVTLNADRSLTVDDRNAQGGELRTTLKANGDGGVDVTNDAHNVDLGGYLVQNTDGTFDPVANSGDPQSFAPLGSPQTAWLDPNIAFTSSPHRVPDMWHTGRLASTQAAM